MNPALRAVTSSIGALIGLAIIAVLVSKQANTTGVISSASTGLNSALATAISPVTGGGGGGGGFGLGGWYG